MTVNGEQPAGEIAQRARFCIFGNSIVSDWRNSLATTSRAIVTALTALGHEALFLEQRRNEPTLELLAAHGAAPLRDFARQFPTVQYRTYDLPAPRELNIWLGREASVADVMIVLADAPDVIREAFNTLDAPYLVRLRQADHDGVSIRLAEIGGDDLSLVYGPAVLPARPDGTGTDDANPGPALLVAYDDAELALRAQGALAGGTFDLRSVVSGAADLPDWEFVPEVELPALYRRAPWALVVGQGLGAASLGRLLLPLAAGCQAATVADDRSSPAGDSVVPTLSLTDLPEMLTHLSRAATVASLPERYDANVVAALLVTAVELALLSRLKRPTALS